jgi:hypothetical protein
VFCQDSYGEALGEASGSEFATLPGVFCPASLLLLLFSLRVASAADFGAPAARTTSEHMAMMQQAVEHGADRGAITEQLAPVLDGPIRGNERAGALVAAHDDLQQFFGGGDWQLAHAQVIDAQVKLRTRRSPP